MKTKSKTRGYIIRSAAYAVFAIQFVVVISVYAQVPQIIGDENIDYCSVNEQFDPASDSWSTSAPIPLPPRINFPAVEVNGRIYVFGGQKPTPVHSLNTSGEDVGLHSVLEYDPIADVWTPKADMPTARSDVAAAVIDGKVYVVGGDLPPHGDVYYLTLEVYDPSSNTWDTTKAPMLYPCLGAAVGVIDGILYVAGGTGFSPSQVYPNILQAYDPATDTWTRKSDMPTARANAGGAVVNNLFYVIGGQGDGAALTTVEAYDPVADSWSPKTPMNTARSYYGAPQVLNGEIYVAGGFTNNSTEIGTSTDSVESYDPASDSWSAHTPLLTARQSSAVGSANGHLYVIGGSLPGAAVQGHQFLYQVVATNQPMSYLGGFYYGLVPGINFDDTTGLYYGIVSTNLPENGALNDALVFRAENAEGDSPFVLVRCRVYNPPPGPVIISNTTATGRINQPFSFQLLSENSSVDTRYSVGNLPPGLSVDRVTGLISGTPTTAGNFVSPAIVTDGTGKGVSYLQLTITDDPDLPVITSSGTAIVSPGVFFSYTITADAAGDCSYIGTDGVEDGALPSGLTFDPSTCTISGTYTPPRSIANRAVARIATSNDASTGTLLGTCQLVLHNANGTGTAPLNFEVQPTPSPTPTPTLTPTPTPTPPPTVRVTVQTNPAGLTFSVDGTTYGSAQRFTWASGSSHTIATTSPQSGGTAVQYVWKKWSDHGAISHTVAPTTNTTYTAKFKTQYFLTMTSGTGGRVSPTSGWKNSGATVSISGTPANGYSFNTWTGSGTGSYSGPNNPASITMGGAITEAATFTHN